MPKIGSKPPSMPRTHPAKPGAKPKKPAAPEKKPSTGWGPKPGGKKPVE